jgi:hypothetical protein
MVYRRHVAKSNLKAGDTVEAEITGIGTLRNPFVAESGCRQRSGGRNRRPRFSFSSSLKFAFRFPLRVMPSEAKDLLFNEINRLRTADSSCLGMTPRFFQQTVGPVDPGLGS